MKKQNIILFIALLGLAFINSCQSVKELGANMAEYNRLVTQPEYLEQRWKEVVAEWKAEVEEQKLGLPEAKTLLHQRLDDNHLLSLSRDNKYGNENAERREWASYVAAHCRPLLEQWYQTLPEKLGIPAQDMEQTMANFLNGLSIERRISMSYEQRNAIDGAVVELQNALLEFFQANGIALTQNEAQRIALLHVEYEQKAAEEKRLAEQKAVEEKRLAEQKAAEEKRLAEQKAAEEKRLAEQKAAEEKRLAEQKAAEERKEIEDALLAAWRKEVIEKGIAEPKKALERLVWLCGDKDDERGEKYYEDFGNFDRLQRKAMTFWDEIESEARKIAHEMFLEMCEEPSFVYPATDICDSSIPIYQDFKSGMSYAYVSGMEQEIIDILRDKGTYVNTEVETKRAEINSKRLYLKMTTHPVGEDSRVWPKFYFAYRDMESTNGVLIGMSLELFASQVPLETAVEKYQTMFDEGMKKNDDGSYTGDNGILLVHIFRTRQTAFGETNIEIFDLAQIDAYNKLYLQREAELKKAAEDAAKAKADALLNF